MQRKPNIKWRESDLQELRRITKNYNAKIARERKKLIESDQRFRAANLPPKASVRDLRKDIETRRDFRGELERMQNFIETGNKFKLDKVTERSLEATARDFNSKIDRLHAKAKTQGERAALPERISPDELLRNANSKEGLQKDIKTFKGFLRRGAETLEELPDTKFNIKLTRWQKETMDQMVNEVNATREKELKEWRETAVKYGGKEAGYTQGQLRMDRGDFDEFSPTKTHFPSSTYGDIRERFKMLMRENQEGYWERRAELARINYTEKLDQLVGDHPIGKMLLKQIKSLDLQDFKRTLKGEDDLFLLLYELEKHPDNYELLLEEVWGEWNPGTDMHDALDNYLERME